jgi:hypothetical protein
MIIKIRKKIKKKKKIFLEKYLKKQNLITLNSLKKNKRR